MALLGGGGDEIAAVAACEIPRFGGVGGVRDLRFGIAPIPMATVRRSRLPGFGEVGVITSSWFNLDEELLSEVVY